MAKVFEEMGKDCIKDSVLVLSGGVDSTTMLWEYRDRIAMAVTFDYGSNHNAAEIECARRQAEKAEVPHIVIPLAFIGKYFTSSLLSGAEKIPEGHYEDSNMKSTVVPFRNGIMLAAACGLAESNGLKFVMIANHGGDHAIYPDCREGFINAMSEAMAQGTYTATRIFAPYTNLTKADIVARGARIGVDYSQTYSCYKGGERHCGRCGTCVERHEAFTLAGVNDPTDYLSLPE